MRFRRQLAAFRRAALNWVAIIIFQPVQGRLKTWPVGAKPLCQIRRISALLGFVWPPPPARLMAGQDEWPQRSIINVGAQLICSPGPPAAQIETLPARSAHLSPSGRTIGSTGRTSCRWLAGRHFSRQKGGPSKHCGALSLASPLAGEPLCATRRSIQSKYLNDIAQVAQRARIQFCATKRPLGGPFRLTPDAFARFD